MKIIDIDTNVTLAEQLKEGGGPVILIANSKSRSRMSSG